MEPSPSASYDPAPASGSPGFAAPPPRRSRWLVWLFVVLPLACLIGLPLAGVGLLAAAWFVQPKGDIHEKHHSLNELGDDKVALIKIDGVIVDGEGFVKQQIDQVLKDAHVKAVVLRIDSPGGSITGSDYMYHHLVKLRKEKAADSRAKTKEGLPMVVSMGGMAASGGYYAAMAVGDEPNVIYAEPTTWTGSIGVIVPLYNVSGLMERFDVQDTSIKSHPLKQMGAPTRKLSDAEKAIFQALVDDAFTRFKEIIKVGRAQFRKHPEKLDQLATGQVYTTNQALQNGLVDREGYLEEAIDRAIELAGLDKKNVNVVEYKRPLSLFDGLMADAHSRQNELAAFLELTKPRAYYLCTWLPTPVESDSR